MTDAGHVVEVWPNGRKVIVEPNGDRRPAPPPAPPEVVPPPKRWHDPYA